MDCDECWICDIAVSLSDSSTIPSFLENNNISIHTFRICIYPNANGGRAIYLGGMKLLPPSSESAFSNLSSKGVACQLTF